MAYVRKMGKQGEDAAGINKTYERFTSYLNPKKYRVPDELDHINRTLIEVKNRKKLDFVGQIQDDLFYCMENGYEFKLKIRKDTILSGPLKRAINAGYITVEYLP